MCSIRLYLHLAIKNYLLLAYSVNFVITTLASAKAKYKIAKLAISTRQAVS